MGSSDGWPSGGERVEPLPSVPDKVTVKMPAVLACRVQILKPKQGSIMPRYFFNTRIGDEVISDPDGEELRNADRAWEVARAMVLELLKIEGMEDLMRAVLEVRDDEGEIVLEFPFVEAILDETDEADEADAPVTKH